MRQARIRKLVIPSAFVTFCLTRVLYSQQVAFPGAEGYGKYTVGGRGGSVYEVTTLNPTGPGSLGAAIAASGPRTVVFRVSGTIDGNFNISNDKITVAGQTAPGDGITIKGTLGTSASDVNIRYLRVRAEGSNDAMGGRYEKNIILDHVSASWSGDEVLSLYHNEDVTIQWSMITEACSTDHRFGGIWGNQRSSHHHNLIAHNDSRNPRWASGVGFNDFKNNVLYNWGYQSVYGGEAVQPGDSRNPPITHSTINMVANYYKPGPATQSGVRDRIANPSARSSTDKGSWYVADNVVEGYPAVTTNNWLGVDGSNYIKLNQPWDAMPINQQTAQDAYTAVLAHAGASLPKRDSVDARIIQEVSTGSFTYGNKGIITTPNDVGGWPVLNSAPAPADSDHDGMPNGWELLHGLNPNLATDRNNDFDSDGYTNLEEYLNDIGAFPAVSPLQFNGGTSNRYAQSQNWAFNWQPSRFDTAVVNNGSVVVDAVGQHAGNLVLASNPGDNVTFNITSGWLKVEDAPSGVSDGVTMIGDDNAATAVLNLSGGKFITKALLKGDGGAFNFTGGVLSAEMVGFDLVNNGGTIAPGAGPGMTHVMGDLVVNSGVLEIEIGGTDVGQYDQLLIDGETMLGGTLNVVPINLGGGLYVPALGDTFTLMASQFGFGEEMFDNLDLPELGTGLNWLLSKDAMTLSLSVVNSPGLQGDYNNDGVVDAADYVVWRKNPANFAGPGGYNTWRSNFGAVSMMGTGSSYAVPEPGAGTWLVAAVSVLFARRRPVAEWSSLTAK